MLESYKEGKFHTWFISKSLKLYVLACCYSTLMVMSNSTYVFTQGKKSKVIIKVHKFIQYRSTPHFKQIIATWKANLDGLHLSVPGLRILKILHCLEFIRGYIFYYGPRKDFFWIRLATKTVGYSFDPDSPISACFKVSLISKSDIIYGNINFTFILT